MQHASLKLDLFDKGSTCFGCVRQLLWLNEKNLICKFVESWPVPLAPKHGTVEKIRKSLSNLMDLKVGVD
eukprot:5587097-Ditylum_brightwellii.AAC.1